MLSYVIPTLLYCTLELYWNLLSQVKDFLPSPLPTQQTPNFWRIRQNDWLLKLEGWEPWLPPSLSSTAPCSNLAHWPCLLFIRQTPVACCILSWVQSSTVLHALPTTERHWLCPEKIQEKLQNNLKSSQVLKAVDANSQIPGKKKKRPGVFSLWISVQLLTGMIFTWGASYQHPATFPADRHME